MMVLSIDRVCPSSLSISSCAERANGKKEIMIRIWDYGRKSFPLFLYIFYLLVPRIARALSRGRGECHRLGTVAEPLLIQTPHLNLRALSLTLTLLSNLNNYHSSLPILLPWSPTVAPVQYWKTFFCASSSFGLSLGPSSNPSWYKWSHTRKVPL